MRRQLHPPRQRKFDGKFYHLILATNSESSAKALVKQIRRYSFGRLIKLPRGYLKGWAIYKRSA